MWIRCDQTSEIESDKTATSAQIATNNSGNTTSKKDAILLAVESLRKQILAVSDEPLIVKSSMIAITIHGTYGILKRVRQSLVKHCHFCINFGDENLLKHL
ncbi:hypothetical protein CEXT_429051 [Caerostris extrusa]|uniref:Uncharacterized protein n=1 Tax=Caerostris extrusa TaxID=172846 RepID=A0AAV4PQS4_CAEEX|nr:hypothetical protein CEXT_429051 [Caerostris extrusa]